MSKEIIDKTIPEFGEYSDKFPHAEVEQKWMHRWVEDKLYRAKDDSGKPTFYILDMYPYPSGAGLHVGHVEGYTATDILARYKRMNGFEVLHPMGWDAFGLPTENYAIKTGKDPHKVTFDNANVFREQCIRTGFSIDWDREIDTSDAEYYKWTQKIFLDLYEQGLAYKAESPVNWCTGCNTVIANEQVEEGHCERCNSDVEMRNIEQWFLKITDYADRLIEDLQPLEWPESTKERQKNWIGKTEGYEIELPLASNNTEINLFLTDPSELATATYILIAPEHRDINTIVTEEFEDGVHTYISTMTPQSERQRKKQKTNTGVYTGNSIINPVTRESMQIWVSDSVLMDEFGGIKLGHPGESSSDEKFAVLHNLPLAPTIQTEMNESVQSRIENILANAQPATHFKLRDWLVSRERYWGAPIPIVHCDDCGDMPVPLDQLPVLLPHIDDFTPTGVPPLAKSEEFVHTTCPHCHGNATRETKTLDTFVDSAWYFLRFADPRNNHELGDKELLNKWLPVDYYVGGADHATGHLLYARFITKVLYDLGQIDFDEPFKTLNHQGMILGEDGRKMSKRWGNVVAPDTVSNEYGSDALRLYEMFLGPLEQSKIWDSKAITGSRRFIDRVWQMRTYVENSEINDKDRDALNGLIENITYQIESSKFNIAVSEFMKYMNYVEKNGKIDKSSYETFLTLLSPFAPFITEELWEQSENKYSIHQSQWPVSLRKEGIGNTVELNIMLNNKFVGTISVQEGSDVTQEQIISSISENQTLSEKLNGIDVKKVIYKPGKVFNILT